jgi:acyl-CoA synthetase (NDP forming)
VLAAFGIAVPRSAVAATPEEAARVASGLAPPLAVKALSPEPIHKSDAGLVRLGLAGAAAAGDAAAAIRRAWPLAPGLLDGFLVEEMAPRGEEIVIGGFRDPQFGPMVMAGLGGVFVEVFADVAFRVCPIGREEARAMLRSLRAWPVIQGARGRAAVDQDAIVDALVRIGGEDGLMCALGDAIEELDVNPLIVSPSGAVAVDARIVLAPAGGSAPAASPSPPESFEPLFHPRVVAVAGVSSSGQGPGNRFIANLRSLGYEGRIVPIHPSAAQVEGLPAVRGLGDSPEPVDYAYIAVPRDGVPPLLAGAGGRVRFAQVMTSGFGEGGAGSESQDALLAAAREGGLRILGPNSLGTYSPRGRITFAETPPDEAVPGGVGAISQSGGIGVDFIRTGQARGLRFSGVVTIGNSADLGPGDFLEHFLADPEIRVVGMYLEDIGEGRRFFELLRSARGRKPVVILKGGRSTQGRKAVMSHTGTLAGDERVWLALAEQTGCVLVDTIEELLDTLLIFQAITARRGRETREIVLFGNGGGASVVATDILAREGFGLTAVAPGTVARLEALDLPAGASGENPIDLPANAFNRSEGRIAGGILDALATDAGTDALLVHLNMPVLISYRQSRIVPNIVDACIAHRGKAGPGAPHLALVLRSDGTEEVDAVRRAERRRAVGAGIPVFETFAAAARALAALRRFEAAAAGREGEAGQGGHAPSGQAAQGGAP